MLSGDALTLGLLEYFGDWRPAAPLSRMLSVSPARMRRALRLLVRTSMLHQSDRPVKPAEQAMTAWSDWNPEAGFFHFFTKDAPYAADTEVAVAYLRKRLEERPVPPSAKPYRNGVRIRLPAVHARDRFSRVLLARRTWRQFGGRPVSVRTLSTLMRLTFGTHKFLDLGAIGKAMLRTSPSAGACHPLDLSLSTARSRAREGQSYVAIDDCASPVRPVVVRRCVVPRADHRGLRANRVEISVSPRLPCCPARGGTLLSDVLPGGDRIPSGALLFGGIGRFTRGARSAAGRRDGIGAVCVRRRNEAARCAISAVATSGAMTSCAKTPPKSDYPDNQRIDAAGGGSRLAGAPRGFLGF